MSGDQQWARRTTDRQPSDVLTKWLPLLIAAAAAAYTAVTTVTTQTVTQHDLQRQLDQLIAQQREKMIELKRDQTTADSDIRASFDAQIREMRTNTDAIPNVRAHLDLLERTVERLQADVSQHLAASDNRITSNADKMSDLGARLTVIERASGEPLPGRKR